MALAVPEFQGLLAELARRMGADVAKLVTAIGRLTPVEQFAFITDAYPELAWPYLSASAELTTQWYDEQPTATSGFAPEPAELPPAEQLAANARWALLQDATVSLLQGAATRSIFNTSRATVLGNAEREGVRWARHASANACGFCRMLATRGAVYHSAALARKGHGGCHCLAVPDRDGKYEPAPYVAQWERDYAAARRAGHTDAASISRFMEAAGKRRPMPAVMPAVKAPTVKTVTAAPAKATSAPPRTVAPPKPPPAAPTPAVTPPAARTFSSTTEGRRWAYSVWGNHRYTTEQFDAIDSYTGSGYKSINQELRKSKGVVRKGTVVDPRIADLDAAFTAAPRVPENIAVTRQTTLAQFGMTSLPRPKDLIGQNFTEHGFLSTSVNKSGVNVSGMADVALTLTVPKGHKAIYVSGDEHGSGALSVVGGGEAELILARETQFRVTKSELVSGRYIVEAEVI